MHAIPWFLKRAFHASLKMMSPIAAQHDLTPARFDLLYALSAVRRIPYQTCISNRLGVTRATICKMVGALEKAGILTRRVDPKDRRYRIVELTRYGRRCFRKLAKRRPVIDRNYYRAMYNWEASGRLRGEFFGQICWRVAHLGRALGDEAILYR